MTHLPSDSTREDIGDDARATPFNSYEARGIREWLQESDDRPAADELTIEQDVRRCLEALNASQAIESLGVSTELRRRPGDKVTKGPRPLTRIVEREVSQARFVRPRLVGDGGYGVVFFVEDRSLGIDVAIKLLRPSRTSLESKYRFFEEAKTMARLTHPGIVRIFDTGTIDGIPFITSSKANGGSLDDLIASHPEGLDPIRATTIVAQVAEAVESAHRQGILHRDLKPANILLQYGEREGEPSERTLLTDFGLAKRGEPHQVERGITEPGDLLGTRRYMSPEQVQGDVERLGPESEVFSLGVVLYQLLTGRVPFDAPSPRQLRERIVGQQHVRPSHIRGLIPRELDAIVGRAMEKQPERRYRTPSALADDLRRFLDRRPVAATNPTWIRQLASAARRHPGIAGSIAAVIGTLLFATIGVGAAWHRQRTATLREEEAKSAWIALCGRMVDEVAAGERPQEEIILEAIDEGIRSLESELEVESDDERTLHRLSVMLHYASVTRRRLGEVEAALLDRLRSCAILKELIGRHPRQAKYRYQFVLGCQELHDSAGWLIESERLRSSAWNDLAQFALAREYPEAMNEHVDRILELASDEVDYRDGAIFVRIKLADHVLERDPKRAVALVEQGIAESIALAEAHDDRPMLIKPALIGLTKLAVWRSTKGEHAEALREIERAEQLFEARLRKVDTFVWVRMEELTLLREKLDLLIAVGEYERAREACERMEQLVDLLEPAPAQRIAAAVARFRLATRRYAIAARSGSTDELPSLEQTLIDLIRAAENDSAVRDGMTLSLGSGPLPDQVRTLLGVP